MTMRYKGVYKMNGEQLTFLKENMDTMKRRDIAKTLGVAPSTMYAHIKRFGGKIRKGHEPKSELRKIVQKYYPIMTPRELVERFGHTRGTYLHYANELGLKRTEECERRLREERVQRVLKVNPLLKDRNSFSKKLQLVRRMEEIRVSSGQPQQTGLRLRMIPLKVYKARWRLLNKKGYIEIIDEPYNFAYDGETERVKESHYEKRYGFKFYDIKDIEVEDD